MRCGVPATDEAGYWTGPTRPGIPHLMVDSTLRTFSGVMACLFAWTVCTAVTNMAAPKYAWTLEYPVNWFPA